MTGGSKWLQELLFVQILLVFGFRGHERGQKSMKKYAVIGGFWKLSCVALV